jgi:phosphoribosylanthranilate isomerase
MIRVKICGITNLEDALAAAELGADAVGFVLYPNSPRCVKPSQARMMIAQVPPYVTTVGVFANQGAKEILDMVEECGFDLDQLQGDEPPEFCQRLGPRVVKAIRVKDHDSIKRMAAYSLPASAGLSAARLPQPDRQAGDGQDRHGVRAFVLDTYREGQFGGTGERFDWTLALQARQYGRIILAGGLTPENVEEAVTKVQPYGVDVSSGVEQRMGKKDHIKIEKFIRQARGR